MPARRSRPPRPAPRPVRRPDLSRAFVEGVFGARDWMQLRDVIRRGIESRAFGAATLTAFLAHAARDDATRRALLRAIVSERSWKRRVSAQSPLSPAEVERMADVAEVVREVRRVYGGDAAAADRFLASPHPRLDGRAPILIAASEGGAQAVRELLLRMEEGAPA